MAASILLQLVGAPAEAAAPDLFRSSDRPLPWHIETATGTAWRWHQVVDALAKERARVAHCLGTTRCRDLAAQPIADLVRSLEGTSERDRVARVNRHFNTFPYVSDRVRFGVRDLWLSPLTFIQTSGDCEDYAIAKYFTLALSGIPDERLWVLMVRDGERGIDHAVLVVQVEGEDYVLDNLTDLAPLSRFPHYRPIYALNASAVWRFDLSDGSTEPRPALRPSAD